MISSTSWNDEMDDLTVSPTAKAGWIIVPGVSGMDRVITDIIGSVINIPEWLESTYRREEDLREHTGADFLKSSPS
jgi:hypothetical protein